MAAGSISFTPASANYANQLCGGVNIVAIDRNALDAPEMGLEIAAALWKLYPTQYKIAGLDTLMVNKASLDAVAQGEDPRRVAEQWQDEVDEFASIRGKYLLY